MFSMHFSILLILRFADTFCVVRYLRKELMVPAPVLSIISFCLFYSRSLSPALSWSLSLSAFFRRTHTHTYILHKCGRRWAMGEDGDVVRWFELCHIKLLNAAHTNSLAHSLCKRCTLNEWMRHNDTCELQREDAESCSRTEHSLNHAK